MSEQEDVPPPARSTRRAGALQHPAKLIDPDAICLPEARSTMGQDESAIEMTVQQTSPKAGAFREPHDYTAFNPTLDPLFRGEIDYLVRMIRMREIYAVELLLAPIGLTLSAWYPLAVLRVEDGMSQRELGLRLNLKDAAIGKAIDALERASLVVRKKDKTDRRKALVRLTREGKSVADKVAEMRDQFQTVVVEGFSDRDKVKFRNLLERAYDNIGKFVTSREQPESVA